MLRLLAVHAHPDDESSKGSATAAYYRSLGARVLVVSCTGGERGDILNPGLGHRQRLRAERDMAGLRREEMARARDVLGIEHRWLGYVDSGMPAEDEFLPPHSFAAIPLSISSAPLVRVLREYRPHVVVTYDENGGYPHPDHIRTHEVTMSALEAAADPTRHPEAGEPWRVPKLYYDRIFNLPRFRALREAMLAMDPPHPRLQELEEMLAWRGEREELPTTTHVPCGDFFEARDAALLAHESQVAPDSSFFFWPNELQRAAWPFEDYELVRSDVPTTLPEHDLFAGIVEDAGEDAR